MQDLIIDSLPQTAIGENNIRAKWTSILEILLIDRTKTTAKTTRNIIWANDNYKEYGAAKYAAKAQIKPELISGEKSTLIMPRALKNLNIQKNRTKTKAEVFTPARIVKKQNDAVDAAYQADDLETYTRRKWLEICCGEAPYMATRYEMSTGDIIPLAKRTGFVDRKLARINAEINDKAEWQHLVELAYKSSYGFEWNGDSLLLARENLLLTYHDYYLEKWGGQLIYGLLEEIAKIISYNLFQMNGLNCTIPLSEKKVQKKNRQLSLFDFDWLEQPEWEIIPGRRVKIMNWDTNKMEFFDREMRIYERSHNHQNNHHSLPSNLRLRHP